MKYMKIILATLLIAAAGYALSYALHGAKAQDTDDQININTGTSTCPNCTGTSTCMDNDCDRRMMNRGTSTRMMNLSDKQIVLDQTMRKLWEDHLVWTRNTILTITDNLAGQNESVARLLKNPTDMADAFRPYYGDDFANKFAALLKDHLNIAADLAAAAKAGDNTKASDLNTKWHQNADQIADLLAQANPNWQRDDVKNMLYQHLDMVGKEAMDRLNKNYSDDVTNYDAMHDQALKMADALAMGIVKQFPDRF